MSLLVGGRRESTLTSMRFFEPVEAAYDKRILLYRLDHGQDGIHGMYLSHETRKSLRSEMPLECANVVVDVQL